MKAHISRRAFLQGAGVSALTLALTACGGGGDVPTSAGDSASPTDATNNSTNTSTDNTNQSGTDSSDENQSKEVKWVFTTNDEGATVLVGYDKSGAVPSGSITLPSNDYDGHIVTVVGSDSVYDAFVLGENNKTVTAVTVPNTVKTISLCALSYSNFTSVSLPEGLETIRWSAFANSNLKEVTIPSTVKSVEIDAFRNSEALVSATIKGDADGTCIFGSCTALKTVTFLKDDGKIGDSAFMGCTALTDVTLPAKLTEIPSSCFLGCTSLETVTIPQTVKYIGFDAFRNCSGLMRLSLPDKTSMIGSRAFEGTALTQLALPEGFRYIETETFKNCKQLKKLYIPSAATVIVADAFDGCDSLTDVYYGGSEETWQKTVNTNKGLAARSANWTMHYNQTRALVGF